MDLHLRAILPHSQLPEVAGLFGDIPLFAVGIVSSQRLGKSSLLVKPSNELGDPGLDPHWLS